MNQWHVKFFSIDKMFSEKNHSANIPKTSVMRFSAQHASCHEINYNNSDIKSKELHVLILIESSFLKTLSPLAEKRKIKAQCARFRRGRIHKRFFPCINNMTQV